MRNRKEKKSLGYKISMIIALVLIVVLSPILIINITLLVKGQVYNNEVPNFMGYYPMVVMTESMEPTINGGDLIIGHNVDIDSIKEGDIITFYDPVGNGISTVTHRVIEILYENGQKKFRTKGDANNTEDTSLVSVDKVIGIYRYKLDGFGNTVLFLSSSTGLAICVLGSLILFVIYDAIRRRIDDKHRRTDTAKLMAELETLKKEKQEREGKEQ